MRIVYANLEQGLLINKLLKMGFVCWFALSQIIVGMSSAYAQSGTLDIEPPLIEHDVVGAVEPGSRQTFFATVVDDFELDSVSLFYRFQKDPTYSSVDMSRVSSSSTYIAHVPTDPDDFRDIEYYIQARDKVGNRTVRGFAFNPLLREIIDKSAPPPSTVAEQPTEAEPKRSNRSRIILYAVLGVLTLGLVTIVASTGGSDGGTSSVQNGDECTGDLCTITVNVGVPE